MAGETEPQPSVETRVLERLGYAHCIEQPIGGSAVTGGNFLDMYQDQERRLETEDILHGFLALDESDEFYKSAREHLLRYLTPYFGEPRTT